MRFSDRQYWMNSSSCFFNNRFLPAAAAEEKPICILAQFVEFVIPCVVKVGFLETL